MARKLLAGTAVGGVLVASFAGCLGISAAQASTSEGDGAAASVMRQAAQETSKIHTVQAEITADAQTAKGPFHSHLTENLQLHPALAASLTVDQATVSGHPFPGSEIVVTGDTVYCKNPLVAKQTGKPWIKISLRKVANKTGIDLNNLLQQAQQQSPSEQTKTLTASKDVRKVGDETVNGVQTTRYAGTVSVQEALGQFTGDARASMEKMTKNLGINKVSFDVWVGRDFLPRKMISKADTAQGAVTSTVLYTAYNKSFTVQTPPGSEVSTFPELSG